MCFKDKYVRVDMDRIRLRHIALMHITRMFLSFKTGLYKIKAVIAEDKKLNMSDRYAQRDYYIFVFSTTPSKENLLNLVLCWPMVNCHFMCDAYWRLLSTVVVNINDKLRLSYALGAKASTTTTWTTKIALVCFRLSTYERNFISMTSLPLNFRSCIAQGGIRRIANNKWPCLFLLWKLSHS